MARTLLKFAFAALLALISAQAVVPSQRVDARIEVVYASSKAELEQLASEKPTCPEIQVRRAVTGDKSRLRPERNVTNVFERPPPVFPLSL